MFSASFLFHCPETVVNQLRLKGIFTPTSYVDKYVSHPTEKEEMPATEEDESPQLGLVPTNLIINPVAPSSVTMGTRSLWSEP